MDLYAWIGEDEFGSGRVGLKQGDVPAGRIALVAMDYDLAKLERLAPQLQAQADQFGQTIRLARFAFAEDVVTLTPRPRG
jgi:hypothetical protein